MSTEYPVEISNFHNSLLSLPGVTEVSSAIDSLDGVTSDDLSRSAYAHLPHGALRRTDGGLSDEALIQFEFYLSQTSEGWRTLEFLAWFIRDQARSGELIQLRPFGLPPTNAGETQLGKTLKFHIDLFWLDSTADIESILKRIESIDRSLKSAIEIYGSVLTSI